MHAYRPSALLPGFTIIEVMVATTIIGIIAASAGLSFLKTQLNARNSQRKEVAQTYSKAVGSYAATNGTSYITVGANSSLCSPPTPGTSGPDLTLSAGNGCVGAEGRSFGMLNYSGPDLVTADINGPSVNSVLGGDSFSYSNSSGDSILQALKQLGFVGTVSTDPSVKIIANTSKDYVLVRCCKDGREAVGTGGSLFAIWAQLERGGSADVLTLDQNSQHFCGGSKVAPPSYNSPDGTGSASKNYQYAFGSKISPVGSMSGNTASYDTTWFAAGNAPVVNTTSLVESCTKNG